MGSELKGAVSQPVLGRSKYSKSCLRRQGFDCPLIGSCNVENILQEFEAEECGLSEFTLDNANKNNFVSNLYNKTEPFKDIGHVASCKSSVANGKKMYLTGSEYNNAWGEIASIESISVCTNLQQCYELSVKHTREYIANLCSQNRLNRNKDSIKKIEDRISEHTKSKDSVFNWHCESVEMRLL